MTCALAVWFLVWRFQCISGHPSECDLRGGSICHCHSIPLAIYFPFIHSDGIWKWSVSFQCVCVFFLISYARVQLCEVLVSGRLKQRKEEDWFGALNKHTLPQPSPQGRWLPHTSLNSPSSDGVCPCVQPPVVDWSNRKQGGMSATVIYGQLVLFPRSLQLARATELIICADKWQHPLLKVAHLAPLKSCICAFSNSSLFYGRILCSVSRALSAWQALCVSVHVWQAPVWDHPHTRRHVPPPLYTRLTHFHSKKC